VLPTRLPGAPGLRLSGSRPGIRAASGAACRDSLGGVSAGGAEQRSTTGPRVRPATRGELGLPNYLIARISARAARTTAPLNLFTTMGRNRGMFRRWLRFASTLMPRGGLPRIDTELVILRVSHRTGAEYEAVHHRRIGRRAGLTDDQIAAAFSDERASGPWTPRQMLLLAAVDELHYDDRISEETFSGLRPELSDNDLVELCMLAGHYSMLAGLINSLGIEPDVHR
jgi:AhpD family alkylhydroperoxidase